MKITNTNLEAAIDIMQEAARWLISINQQIWPLDNINKANLLRDNSEDNFYVGWDEDTAIASMILKWHDPDIWIKSKESEAGYINKLSVRRAYASQGYAQEMMEFAEEECRKRHIHKLRLDTLADRPRLCKIYEDFGFKLISREIVKGFDFPYIDLALYEKDL